MINPKVLIATPAIHTINTQFYLSMMKLQASGRVSQTMEVGSLVYMARNKMALTAIQNGFDYIVWIDSDMVFPPDTVKRLMAHAQYDRDFVSALCFGRSLPTSPRIMEEIIWEQKEDRIIHDATPYNDYPKNSTFEIGGAGFGCCMTSVKMIKEVAAAFGQPPFDPLPQLGEDYSFCWKAAKLGYKFWCDSRIKIGHVGEMIYDEGTWLAQQGADEG